MHSTYHVTSDDRYHLEFDLCCQKMYFNLFIPQFMSRQRGGQVFFPMGPGLLSCYQMNDVQVSKWIRYAQMNKWIRYAQMS